LRLRLVYQGLLGRLSPERSAHKAAEIISAWTTSSAVAGCDLS
jgi:hypothetical protein